MASGSKKKAPLLGAHMSTAGGYHKAVERGVAIGCTTMQIFTKSNKSWLGKKITSEEAAKFRAAVKESGMEKIMVHTSYLINLGAKNPDVLKKSKASLIHELNRCAQLDIKYLVLHPGAHVGAGEEVCMEKIGKSLDYVFEHAEDGPMILLETAAGQGTTVGHSFEQLRTIMKHCSYKRRVGICLDTCHVYAAGYNIATPKGLEETIQAFDKILGLGKLKAIHLNDSKTELGSRKDRHELIGKGHIPVAAFGRIMQDPRLEAIPKVLETPVESDEEYGAEIKLLGSKC